MEKERKSTVLIHEAGGKKDMKVDASTRKKPEFKKAAIYGLLAIAFAGCLYLIFRPDEKKVITEAGLNNALPQANDAGLLGDKEKAYEQELLEKKQNERKNAMLSLSDYWNSRDSVASTNPLTGEGGKNRANPTLTSRQNYEEIQNTLGSFYHDDNEKETLRKEIRELKREKANAASSQDAITNDPIAMMEKSYQMAAKYLPQVMPQQKPAASDTIKQHPVSKRYIEPVYMTEKSVVSSLTQRQQQTDQEFVASVLNGGQERFFNGGIGESSAVSKILSNSIHACIHRTQTITVGSSIPLRLLEGIRIAGIAIPPGTLLTARAGIRDGRLGLEISSVEYKGKIVPVEISAYDLDGQPGLNLPYTPDVNAIKEIASGMSSSAGTNIVLSSSTGQQLISDLTKGVVQGASGYLAKRIGAPKVTVKAGYLLFLLPKNNKYN
ncbi:conjugative transposon protein TraM [Chryseobacterium sp. CKR4-1]|uniref:conjugative transposon protein TraM n=1 Tax=Chryseobacterium sp. CKR4-1 TaxID=3068896 RepID=UPI0027966B41|nr:conjugative transposon protein TraM [Chryseobacterium sp. CKR4-1]MDQ1803087.1 conjugative transposon protein TraM [Chryseobacterium sp. CKR4-1]